MGRPFSQQPDAAAAACTAAWTAAVDVVAPLTGVLAPPPPVVVAVVAVDEGERAPGLRAPADMAGEVAVVGWPPLTRSCGAERAEGVTF